VACRWMYDRKEKLRWYYPQCWGGLYDISGCYCDDRKQGHIEQLENRIEELERKVSALSNGDRA
jgi:hypothetical protein